MTPFSSEYSLVTKNALVSVAADRSSRVMPASVSRSAPASASSPPSPASKGSASAPFSWALRKFTMPPTYSGTTSTSPGKVGM